MSDITPVAPMPPPDLSEDVSEDDLFEITDQVVLNAYLEKTPTGEFSGVALRIRIPESEKVIDKGVGLAKIIGEDIVEYFTKKSKQDDEPTDEPVLGEGPS